MGEAWAIPVRRPLQPDPVPTDTPQGKRKSPRPARALPAPLVTAQSEPPGTSKQATGNAQPTTEIASKAPETPNTSDVANTSDVGTAQPTTEAVSQAPETQESKSKGRALAKRAVAQLNTDQPEQDTGNNHDDVLPPDPPAGRTHARDVAQRLQRDGRWPEVEPVRDQMMMDAATKKRFPDKAERQAWVYSEIDRLYPPQPKAGGHCATPLAPTGGQNSTPVGADSTNQAVSGRISGLASLPEAWPELPSNASLAAEINWVQANRLLVVEEKSSGATVVHLDRARSPAPSWAALGWLETSIRSYAKFIDVASKAMTTATDEVEQVRRERMAIEEVRQLLGEMIAVKSDL